MQHTLPHGMVLDTEYIGTKGTHLGILENPNRSVSSIANTALQINNATSFSYQTEGANSHYNAAQVRLTRRLSRSVSANTLYTFAKGIDDASSFNGTGGTVVQFLDNRRAGTRTLHLRRTAQSERRLPAFFAGGRARPAAQRRLEDAAAAELEYERQFQCHHRHSADGEGIGQPVQYGRPGGRRQSARGSDGAADRGAGRYVLQYAGVHHSAGRPVRQRGPEHDSGTVPRHHQFQFESLFPLPGEPAHADVFA